MTRKLSSEQTFSKLGDPDQLGVEWEIMSE